MAKVLIFSFSNLRSDPRVMRQIRALSHRHELVTCGYGEPPDGAGRHVEVQPDRRRRIPRFRGVVQLKLGMYDSFYRSRERVRSARSALAGARFDLVVANDIWALPLALDIAASAPVLFDAHEYSPLEFEDRWFWRFFFASYVEYLCRRYVPRASRMVTVCQGIADRYAANYGVQCDVITNAPGHVPLPVRPTRDATVQMVHHGAAIASRRTELMIDLMDHLEPRFTLDMVLVPGDASYIERLRRRAASNPRIRFLPPLPMDQLVTFCAGYDVGLFLLPPTNFNYRMALPNKFFEFVQARLAIAIGPSPEMARLVRQYDCGLIADNFDPRALAARLNDSTADDFDRMKRGADRAAAALNAEANEGRFVAMVEELLHRDTRGIPRLVSA